MAIILPIATKFNDSGVRKAKSSFGGLSKSLKGLAGAAGLAIGLGAVVTTLKESAMAAAADAKSQRLLALQMKTTTKATTAQIASTEDFISSLSMATGIMDDDLRPVMANAVRGTGSVAKAQKLLAIALDGAAASGKPVDAVMQALIRAQNGNTASLYKLAPQLKATKGDLDDYAASVKGAAETSANPFDRFAVSMDSLKEKVGTILLPLMNEFVTYLQNEVLPKVSQFLDDVQNPDTEVGAAWVALKTTIGEIISGFKTFFEQFSANKNATEGLINVMNAIVKALPALLAIKGIMVLASAGKALKNLTDFFMKKFPTGGVGTTGTNGNNVTPVGGATGTTGTTGVVKGGIGWGALKPIGGMASLGLLGASGAGIELSKSEKYASFQAAMKRKDWKGAVYADPASAGYYALKHKDSALMKWINDNPQWKSAISVAMKAAGMKIPQMANGGIVMPSAGGSMVNVGEAGKAEAIIPLDKLNTLMKGRGGSTVYNITVNAGMGTNGTKVGSEIINQIKAYERTNGNGWRK